MSDTITPRVEPTIPPGPNPGVTPVPPERAVVPVGEPVETRTAGGSSVGEVLARLEDKTARIEEKLSRAEASTQRVVDRFEAASHRMSEVAQQSELAAVRSDTKYIARRVKNLAGLSALVLTALISAVLSAVLVVLILRFMPGLLVR